MEHDDFLSKCHNAPYRSVGGITDFIGDKGEGVTMHAECTKCGEPCDLLPNPLHPDNYPERYPKEKQAIALKKECDAKFNVVIEKRELARSFYQQAMSLDDPVERAKALRDMGNAIEDCITSLKVIGENIVELEAIVSEPLV